MFDPLIKTEENVEDAIFNKKKKAVLDGCDSLSLIQTNEQLWIKSRYMWQDLINVNVHVSKCQA